MIEVFFDCSSPWTYLAFANLRAMATELDVKIKWRPTLVGGVFNSVNPSVYAQRADPVPAKARYMRKDLADWARHTGLRIKFPPSVFPVNSVKAMRACIALEPQGKLVDFAAAAFEAYWSDDRDLAREEVLADIAQRAGLDRQRFFAGIETDACKARLRANTDELIARGGFGSPTMFVGNSMFFGNDRLPLVKAALEAA
jgi:2-hydroxychromene-2-carboxylate isomerase